MKMPAFPRSPRGRSATATAASAVLAGAILLYSAALPLMAQTAQPTQDQIAALDILPGWTTDTGTRIAAFRLRLAPGWKTYWRAPGDAGIPPLITLSGQENIGSMAINWPVPEVFYVGGMRSIGYHDSVILPIEITPTAGGSLRLSGVLEIGVCDDICVPARLEFDALLPEGGARNGQIVAALINQPQTGSAAGVGDVTCTLTPTDRGMDIVVRADVPPLGAQEEAVIEAGDANIWVSVPDMTRAGNTIEAHARMRHVDGGAFAIDRSAVRMTLLAEGRGIDILGCSAG